MRWFFFTNKHFYRPILFARTLNAGFFLVALLALLPLVQAEVRVYTEEYPPYNFTKKGVVQGYAVDIVTEIMKRNGLHYKIEVLPWARAYDEALKLPDRIIFSISKTPEREKLFKWVGPIARFTWVFLAKNDSKIKLEKLEDAKKVKKVGVVKEDVQDQHLRQLQFQNLEQGPNNKINLKKLNNGLIDVWFTSTNVYPILIKELALKPGQFRELLRLEGQSIYIGFSKTTNDKVIAAWQASLDEMSSDGTLEKIQQKWPLVQGQ